MQDFKTIAVFTYPHQIVVLKPILFPSVPAIKT